jgi:hypothetical protein
MAKRRKNSLSDRDREPDIILTKQQGLRQIIHAAIRSTLASEDPYAIHLLVKSAETVLSELIRARRLSDPLPLRDFIKPEFHDEFFALHNETNNFLKHGRFLPEGAPIYSIVRSNDVHLWVNCHRFRILFDSMTYHMEMFVRVMAFMHPNWIKWDDPTQRDKLLAGRSAIKPLTRGACLGAFDAGMQRDGLFQAERKTDLVDVENANQLTLDN